ncbi:MAG: hypothetical protein QOI92_285 [Chloroflexota bacterium]|jgi:hypothetical protein|nr:hypothetical protein [Chloroflexota bacterium]
MSAMTAFADEVKRVRNLGVATGDIAVATGSQPGTVNAWARATRQPSGSKRDRLLELVALVDRLERVMAAAYVPLWLLKPITALGDRPPLELLSKGRYRDVSRVVAELENDSFA